MIGYITHMSTTAKAHEKQFGDYLSKLIYAVFDDIDLSWNGDQKCSPLVFQSYKNLCADKKDRGAGLKNRFTISDPVRQFLAFLHTSMLEELGGIVIDDGDSVATIGTKLLEANPESYTAFMYQVASANKARFGPTLKSACDSTRWFHGQIVGALTGYAARPVITAVLSTEFDSFMKSLAWLIGKLIFYHEMPVTETLFMGLLAQQAVCQEMLDVLQSSLRAKVPAKPRPNKKAAVTPAVAPSGGPLVVPTADPIITPPEKTAPPPEVIDADIDDMLLSI
jgi:hypothetical protein